MKSKSILSITLLSTTTLFILLVFVVIPRLSDKTEVSKNNKLEAEESNELQNTQATLHIQPDKKPEKPKLSKELSRKNARLAHEIANLVRAWHDLNESYPHEISELSPNVDTAYHTGSSQEASPLIRILTTRNPEMRSYISKSCTKADSQGKAGFIQIQSKDNSTVSKLDHPHGYQSVTDSWGNGFIVIVDHSGDDIIKVYKDSSLSKKLGVYAKGFWEPACIVVISGGPDGELDGSNDIVVIY